MAVLREVKYLNFQQQKDIPTSAETLFSENETFRKFVGNLELIVGWYNEVSRCGLAYSNAPPSLTHMEEATVATQSVAPGSAVCVRLGLTLHNSR